MIRPGWWSLSSCQGFLAPRSAPPCFSGEMKSTVANVWPHRDLLLGLIRSALRQHTAGTWLGWGWWLLDPLILMGLYWLLVLVLNRSIVVEAFPIFVLCGLIPWKWTSTSAAYSSSVLYQQRALLQSFAFPKAILPLVGVGINAVFTVFSLALLSVAASLSGRSVGASMVQVLPLIVIMLVALTGLALIIAAISVFVRDIAYVVQYVFRLLLYSCPVMYQTRLVERMIHSVFGESSWQGWTLFMVYQINPLTVVIRVLRSAIYEPGWAPMWQWAVLVVEAVVMLGLGYVCFRRAEKWVVKLV